MIASFMAAGVDNRPPVHAWDGHTKLMRSALERSSNALARGATVSLVAKLYLLSTILDYVDSRTQCTARDAVYLHFLVEKNGRSRQLWLRVSGRPVVAPLIGGRGGRGAGDRGNGGHGGGGVGATAPSADAAAVETEAEAVATAAAKAAATASKPQAAVATVFWRGR